MTFKVIKRGNLPARLPLHTWLLVILALDHWNAADWVWGTVITTLSIMTVAILVHMFNEEQVDLLKDGKSNLL